MAAINNIKFTALDGTKQHGVVWSDGHKPCSRWLTVHRPATGRIMVLVAYKKRNGEYDWWEIRP